MSDFDFVLSNQSVKLIFYDSGTNPVICFPSKSHASICKFIVILLTIIWTVWEFLALIVQVTLEFSISTTNFVFNSGSRAAQNAFCTSHSPPAHHRHRRYRDGEIPGTSNLKPTKSFTANASTARR